MPCKRCPFEVLITPFWSPIKHLLLCGFITIWFTVGCRVALEVGFCTLFKVICLRKCNVFSGWGNAVFSEKMVWYSKPIIYLAHGEIEWTEVKAIKTISRRCRRHKERERWSVQLPNNFWKMVLLTNGNVHRTQGYWRHSLSCWWVFSWRVNKLFESYHLWF